MLIPDSSPEEHIVLRDALQKFLLKNLSERDLRRMLDLGASDRAIWRLMDSQLGLAGLGIPEVYGGGGAGLAELALVQGELGATLVPVPFLSTSVMAVRLILATGDREAWEAYLPRIAAAELVATVCLDCSGTDGTLDLGHLVARQEDGSWHVTGEYPYVLDGAAADLLLVYARTDHGISTFAIESSARGVSRRSLETLDLTRSQGSVSFSQVRARLLGPEGNTEQAWSETLLASWLALVAEQTGGADRLVTESVNYAKVREQFGRPIGSFQAIKHKLADMAVDLERMKSAQWALLASLEDPSSDDQRRRSAAHLAVAFCSDAYFKIAASAIQVHGGIGFTWEHSAHLYFRRANSSSMLLGTTEWHRSSLLAAVERHHQSDFVGTMS